MTNATRSFRNSKLRTRRRAQAGPRAQRRRASRHGVSRRLFLGATAAAGATLGLPGLLSGQGGPRTARTLFFNLAHENLDGKDHVLWIAGRHYPLTKVRTNPTVLAAARQNNSFLRAVPDSQVTHHVVGAMVPTDISTLGYVWSSVDQTAGTWSMSMIVQHLPATAVPQAFARARARTPQGPLALSAKRELYGHPAAMTELDLHEEQALVDATDHARTLIGLHPDLLCAEPNGAQQIHTNYISTNGKTRFLARLLQARGAATPQATPGQPNAQGWATLRPLTSDATGQPYKTTDGRLQYFPDWHPSIDQQVAGAVNELHHEVKNDESLGANVTGYVPVKGQAQLAGKVWFRHDGVVPQGTPVNALREESSVHWDYQQKNGETGLVVTSPSVEAKPDGSVTVTLSNVNNWFLRFLGMYLQFVGPNGNLIPVSSLPTDTIEGRLTTDSDLNKDYTLYAGLLTPATTAAGIPVYPGQLEVEVNIPPAAQTVRVLYGGPGASGSRPSDAELNSLTVVGEAMTGVFCYGVIAMFMAVGVSTLDGVVQFLISAVGETVVEEIVGVTGRGLAGQGGILTPEFGIILLKGILGALFDKGLEKLLEAITLYVTTAQAADAIPVVGQVLRAAAAVIGTIQLAQSSIEIGLSPHLYQFDLALTHDLTLNLLPDANNNQFPQLPAGYTLYYQVAYLFDNGATPVKLDPVDVPDVGVRSIPVTLSNIARGGQVNVSVGFYARHNGTPAGQNDWCAAKGSTGLVNNTVDTAPDIVIEQIKIPILPTTRYLHTRKTALDAAGRHLWTNTAIAPGYTPPSGAQAPGSLGALRSITVRQGTSKQEGYVGYAWQAYSRRLNDCTAGSPGQLDQAANLNTNPDTAQSGYATTACGLQGGALSGVKLTYDLLGNDQKNYFLDTSSLKVRQVQLNPPSFASPAQGQAFAQLNLDSTRLLLHPAGHIVSINNANHKLEALKLPATPMADADAKTRLVARTYAGQGSRPGLMRSPMAAAISPEGIILVLEDSQNNNRIQAFDLGGNAVSMFPQQKSPYFLQLDATAGMTYLDIAVEYTGYLYVLAQDVASGRFRLDIYHPSQTGTQPISTTYDVNAARLAVDFWRSVYTLNYEVLQLPGGAIPDLTEPSVSLWVPSLPESASTPSTQTTHAVAGPKEQFVHFVETRLDGTQSTSFDGKPLTYAWRAVGRQVALLQPNTATPVVQFSHGGPGPYTFELVVTDSRGRTSSDRVTVYYLSR